MSCAKAYPITSVTSSTMPNNLTLIRSQITNLFIQSSHGAWKLRPTSPSKHLPIFTSLWVQSAHLIRYNVMLLGTWPLFFFSFLTAMYLYNHMTPTHMTAYLYNRATSSGTSLFPPFVRLLLFSSYGSLWPPLFVTPLFCDCYCSWLYCSPLLYA